MLGSTAEAALRRPHAARRGQCLLAFCLLYTPCVAAIASIRRELGGKWAAFVVVGQCVVAWFAALIVHLIGAVIGLA